MLILLKRTLWEQGLAAGHLSRRKSNFWILMTTYLLPLIRISELHQWLTISDKCFD